jgi:hypothetical protein
VFLEILGKAASALMSPPLVAINVDHDQGLLGIPIRAAVEVESLVAAEMGSVIVVGQLADRVLKHTVIEAGDEALLGEGWARANRRFKAV